MWQPAASHRGKHCTAGWKRLPHFLFEDYFKAKNKVSMTQKYKSSALIAHDFEQSGIAEHSSVEMCSIYYIKAEEIKSFVHLCF